VAAIQTKADVHDKIIDKMALQATTEVLKNVEISEYNVAKNVDSNSFSSC